MSDDDIEITDVDTHAIAVEAGLVVERLDCDLSGSCFSPTGKGLAAAIDVLDHLAEWLRAAGPQDEPEWPDTLEAALSILQAIGFNIAPDDDLQSWHLRVHHDLPEPSSN